MPLVKIEIRAGKSEEYKKALLDGVHQALVQSIKIPDYDRTQRLYDLHSDNFEAPPNKTDATIIEITMFKGMSHLWRIGESEAVSLPMRWILESK